MSRWISRVGWRHLVAVLAVVFSLFPIVFVLSAALNPLGTLSSTEAVPTGASFGNFTRLLTGTDFPRWFANSVLIAGLAAATATRCRHPTRRSHVTSRPPPAGGSSGS